MRNRTRQPGQPSYRRILRLSHYRFFRHADSDDLNKVVRDLKDLASVAAENDSAAAATERVETVGLANADLVNIETGLGRLHPLPKIGIEREGPRAAFLMEEPLRFVAVADAAKSAEFLEKSGKSRPPHLNQLRAFRCRSEDRRVQPLSTSPVFNVGETGSARA